MLVVQIIRLQEPGMKRFLENTSFGGGSAILPRELPESAVPPRRTAGDVKRAGLTFPPCKYTGGEVKVPGPPFPPCNPAGSFQNGGSSFPTQARGSGGDYQKGGKFPAPKAGERVLHNICMYITYVCINISYVLSPTRKKVVTPLKM